MLKALDDLGIGMISEVINEIYDSSEIPEELNRSIFLVMSMKSHGNKFGHY